MITEYTTKIVKKPSATLASLFWVLIPFFVAIITVIFLPFNTGYVLHTASIIFLLLGIVVLVLTIRQKIERLFKSFLILTSASAIAIPLSFALHGFTYGPFFKWLEINFWGNIGIGDEPFFFILATVIFPIAFLVGLIGSIVLFKKISKVH